MRSVLQIAAVAALGLAGTVSAAIDPIAIKGSKFFNTKTGDQFFLKGVAYQADLTNATSDQQFVDPLADTAGCKRDIPLLQAVDTNVVRVYAIDTTQNHDDCMSMLEAAGIYVVADLSEPGLSINRDTPAWDASLYARYTSVVDEMQKYPNVLGFFAGNEVTNNNTNTNASPFVKAAVRDVKAYIKSKNYRSIPVGYATNDDDKIRNQMAAYFNCGDEDSTVDFWGYNIYSWCDPSSLQISGWDQRTKEYENYSVPVFMAEYGCNNIRPRKFGDVGALYGTVMAPVWSGGIVYMYFEEANKYGLVDVRSGSLVKLGDYNNYQTAIEAVKPVGVKMASYTPTNTAQRACPTAGANWAASTALPPTPNESLCQCAQKTFSCVPKDGLDPDNYQAMFDYICGALGEGGCDGISANGTSGDYGSYSVCEPEIRLGWALDQYYQFQKGASDACDFKGNAVTQTASDSSDSCQKQIDNAGGSGGSSSSGGSSGTGTDSGSGSDSSGKPNAGIAMQIPAFNMIACAALFGGFAALFL